MSIQSFVRLEDIKPHPIEHWLNYGSDDPNVQVFMHWYVRPVQMQRRNGAIEIRNPGIRLESLVAAFLHAPEPAPITVADPIPYLNLLLYQVKKTGNADVPILSEIVLGLSNCGQGFYQTFNGSFKQGELLSPDIKYPPYLVVHTANGSYFTRAPESSKEQMYHCIWHVRQCMAYLARQPIGTRSILSTTDIAHRLNQLARRTAYIRTGTTSSSICTYDTVSALEGPALADRVAALQAHTRAKYCQPREGASHPGMPPPTDDPEDETPLSRWKDV